MGSAHSTTTPTLRAILGGAAAIGALLLAAATGAETRNEPAAATGAETRNEPGAATGAETRNEPGAATGAETREEADLARQAAERLVPFKQALKAALQAGLAEGPAEAVDACRLRAPEIAEAHSQDGVRVGRTSHRLRNPANTGPDWVAPALSAWTAADADRTPRVVPLGDDRVGYVEPILTQALCLTCHGETLAPPIAERIRTLYPEDRAVGFREGELRGVFWIELPAR